MAEPKELHFFDRQFGEKRHSWMPTEHEAKVRYGASFQDAPAGMTTGEFTPAYAVMADEMIARVRRWMPKAKLLFIMRDPVARAWSHARKDFAKYWARDGMKLEGATVDDLRPFFESENVASRGDYLSCLRAWYSHFPKDQIWTGFMDDVASGDEAQVLKSVFGFLGVDAEVEIDEAEAKKVVNPRAPVQMPDGLVAYLKEQLYGQNGELSELLGRTVPWEE